MIRKAFKYRLYPNAEQREMLAQHFGCVRWIYNWAIDRQQESHDAGEGYVSRRKLQDHLPGLKRQEETKWLARVNAQSLQAALKNLDGAFKDFFDGERGYPRYKSKRRRQSFEAPQRGEVNFESGTIKVPKIPPIRAKLSRQFVGTVKTVTVSQNPSGRYFASVLVEVPEEVPEKPPIDSDTTVGVDLGISHFATLSTGEKIENPRLLGNSLKRLGALQRRMQRKEKGSENREKARRKVARLHEHIANQRKDFLHKLTARLTAENQTVAIETLNVSGMRKNRCLSRAISDVGWFEFRRQLEYKSDWYGVNLLKIGRFEPSTRRCTCGHVNGELTLSDRQWTCPACGKHIADRDVHAARQIKQIALSDANVGENNTAGTTERACGDAAPAPRQLSLALGPKA